MKKSCVSLLVFFSFSIDQLVCQEDLIYGGIEVRPQNKYPWMVTIGDEENNTVCGGSLISNRYVLTAGHCLTKISPVWLAGKENDTKTGEGKEMAYNIVMGIGVHDKRFPAETVLAEKITFGPDFSVLENDIVLIKLNRTIEFKDNIRPICIPEDKRFERPYSHLTISGWGTTTNGSTNVLTEAQIRLLPHKGCLDLMMREMQLNLTWPLLCAEMKGKNSCPGDSGGPLFVREGKKYYIIGVSSFGPKVCERNVPSGYTQVSSFYNWIKNNSDYSEEKCKISNNT